MAMNLKRSRRHQNKDIRRDNTTFRHASPVYPSSSSLTCFEITVKWYRAREKQAREGCGGGKRGGIILFPFFHSLPHPFLPLLCRLQSHHIAFTIFFC